MRILADHCIPASVIGALRAEGLDVVRLVDVADPRSDDRDVVRLADRLGAVLLTSDGDFKMRSRFPPRRHRGIVLLRDLTAAPERVMRRLTLLLSRGQSAVEGRLVILNRRSARARR